MKTTVLGRRAMDRLAELAKLSEPGPGVTRLYLTPEHRAAIDLLAGWMEAAGMRTEVDAVANLVGHYPADRPDAPVLILGSHHDSVREGGAYDGAMGVVLAITVVEALHAAGRRLPFAIDIVAFGDEEGVRFGTTFVGSHALAGRLDRAVLSIADDTGITLAQALQTFGCDPSVIGTLGRPAGRTIGYLEAHIEQGPVLEAEGLPVGVVTAIAGATRTLVHVKGVAGHAGTVPMTGRRDALAGAAECVLAVERCCTGRDDVVGTVGKFQARPGAVNVIAGEVTFSIDVRAPDDDERDEALRNIEAAISVHCGRRHLSVHMEEIYREPATPMDEGLTEVLAGAIADLGLPVRRLPSGAGHDAMAMAALCPTAMLFVRCEKGISHNPAENVTADDVGTAAAVMLRFLERLAERPSPS